MNELLKKLLEAEILTEDTKKELEAAITTSITEAIEVAKAEATADVRAQLTEQWLTEREALIEAVDSKVTDFLADEIKELKEDIDRFRDLEAEHAEKLVEAKKAMADELKSDLVELVEKLDNFLEIRLNAEVEELREDIEEQKKVSFGRKMFEAFVAEYKHGYAEDGSIEAELQESEHKLATALAKLDEAEKQIAKANRKQVMESVLTPLSGRQREVMEAILKNVETDQLQEAYKTFIGRVIRESAPVVKEKEDKVLAEGATDNAKKKAKLSEGILQTGDNVEKLQEEKLATASRVTNSDALAQLRKIAGIA